MPRVIPALVLVCLTVGSAEANNRPSNRPVRKYLNNARVPSSYRVPLSTSTDTTSGPIIDSGPRDTSISLSNTIDSPNLYDTINLDDTVSYTYGWQSSSGGDPLPVQSTQPVPAPGAALLGMMGLAGVGYVRRRFS